MTSSSASPSCSAVRFGDFASATPTHALCAASGYLAKGQLKTTRGCCDVPVLGVVSGSPCESTPA